MISIDNSPRPRLGFVSPIYWHAATYRRLVNYVERGTTQERYREIAAEIGDASVLDLCCGDCYLLEFLSHRRYRGIDINPGFVGAAHARGIEAWCADPLRDGFPEERCITILHSLYQFHPDHEELLEAMIARATGKVVVCEATSGLILSPSRLGRMIARAFLATGARPVRCGLGLSELEALAARHGALRTVARENWFLAVFAGRAGQGTEVTNPIRPL
jgi:SAM-dependent methyltransferase